MPSKKKRAQCKRLPPTVVVCGEDEPDYVFVEKEPVPCEK
jgi:hypothetical protein